MQLACMHTHSSNQRPVKRYRLDCVEQDVRAFHTTLRPSGVINIGLFLLSARWANIPFRNRHSIITSFSGFIYQIRVKKVSNKWLKFHRIDVQTHGDTVPNCNKKTTKFYNMLVQREYHHCIAISWFFLPF